MVKDIRFGTDIGTIITNARMKAANALKATKLGMIGNVKEVNNLTRFLTELVKDKAPDEYLFDGWTDKKANGLHKEGRRGTIMGNWELGGHESSTRCRTRRHRPRGGRTDDRGKDGPGNKEQGGEEAWSHK